MGQVLYYNAIRRLWARFMNQPIKPSKEEQTFDLYKERGKKTELFAEPTNLFSNIAFFAAAFMCFPFAKSWIDGILVMGIILVGLGSSMYHSGRCQFTLMWDAGSIVLWILYYLFIWAHFLIGLSLLWSGVVVCSFMLLGSIFNRKYGNGMNGSFDYIPVIILLLVCGSVTWWALGLPHMVAAGVLSAISLVFRVVDNDVSIPTGTHYI